MRRYHRDFRYTDGVSSRPLATADDARTAERVERAGIEGGSTTRTLPKQQPGPSTTLYRNTTLTDLEPLLHGELAEP